MNLPSFQHSIIRVVCGIIAIVSICLLIGCETAMKPLIDDEFVESLADTAYSGEQRLVYLSDGTGGFYYDDVFRSPDHGEYGYSRWERRYLAGWELFDTDGNRLDINPDHCVVHPNRIDRKWMNGLVEMVETPYSKPGLIVSTETGNENPFVFRPVFDFRRLGHEESAKYLSEWIAESNVLTIVRSDSIGGWLGITCGEGVEYRISEKAHRFVYARAELTGRPGVSQAFSPGEFIVDGGSHSFAFGWGENRDKAVAAAVTIRDSLNHWRELHHMAAKKILGNISFRCEDRKYERAFAWACLTLHKLQSTRNGQRVFTTGIPYNPYPDGWHTCLSVPALVVSGYTPEVAADFLEVLVQHQNTDSSSVHYGMFPGAIREGGVEYRIPEIAGLAGSVFQRIMSFTGEKDSVRSDRMAVALALDLMGTARSRVKRGLVVNEPNEHFLWDGFEAPDRSGATIETQVLFSMVRGFLDKYPNLDRIAPGMPMSLISAGGGLSAVRTSSPLVALSEAGQFSIPVDSKMAINLFRDPQSRQWADRLVLSHTDDNKEQDDDQPSPVFDDRIAGILAVSWYKPKDRRLLQELLDGGEDTGLIGEVGFRTLAESDPKYESTHLYLLEEEPTGTKANGDVLVWTAGKLADMMSVTGRWDSLATLVDRLADRIMKQGVIGALAEAENSESIKFERNIVGNPVHVTSTAEFVRLFCEDVIGADVDRGPYLTLRPRFPMEWGRIELELARAGGVVRLSRDTNGIWMVSQTGIKPYVQLALEVIPKDNTRALGSVRIYPGGEAEIEFVPAEGDRWKATIRRQ